MKTCLLLLVASASAAMATNLTTLCADRAAIERVYYEHRLSTKPPFAEALPPATLETLVRTDLRKEAALQRNYGVTVTAAQLTAEAHRIDTTTQAPEMLAEIKAALGHDAERFANAFAKPIVVERELRRRFDHDNTLHGAQRRELERLRSELIHAAADLRGRSPLSHLAPTGGEKAEVGGASANNQLVERLLTLLKQGHSNDVNEITWQLGARPAEKPIASIVDELEIKKRFGPNAQLLSSSQSAPVPKRTSYFEDLPEELQQLLRTQLHRAGDISAPIEMPGGFLLFLTKEKSAETLTVAVLSLRKRSYDEWVAGQSRGEPERP